MRKDALMFFAKLAVVAAADGDGNSEALAARVRGDIEKIPDKLFPKTIDALREDERAAERASLGPLRLDGSADPEPAQQEANTGDTDGDTTADPNGDTTVDPNAGQGAGGGVTDAKPAESTQPAEPKQLTPEEMAAKFAPNTASPAN